MSVSDGNLNLSIGEDDAATEHYPNIVAIRIHAAGGGSTTRVITIHNIDGAYWDIVPSGTEQVSDTTTTFSELDSSEDHTLTAMPSAGG